MKKLIRKEQGFTLVELLIVISLIAILAVGVLATINPVEQKNKAQDANTANDAGEILNAYERYYAQNGAYPWTAVNVAQKSDSAFMSRSDMNGFGLCGSGTSGLTESCTSYSTPGILVSSDELKSSFLEKRYGDAGIDDLKKLFLVKTPVAESNSIYVCYVPTAKSNRTTLSNLKDLAIVDDVATSMVDVGSSIGPYFNGTTLLANWDFSTLGKSLFKCVP